MISIYREFSKRPGRIRSEKAEASCSKIVVIKGVSKKESRKDERGICERNRAK